MRCCASLFLALVLAVPARAQGAFEPARTLYLQGNLRGALQVALEGLSAAPGDARLERLQRLVLDEMLEAERGRLAGESAGLRRRAARRTVEVREALDCCRRADLARNAGSEDWARSLYERARDVLPRHPCWRAGLAALDGQDAPAPKARPVPRLRRRPATPAAPAPPPAEALAVVETPEPARGDPEAAHRAYLEGLSSYLWGLNARARESLQEAVRLDPSHTRARNLLERVGREGEP